MFARIIMDPKELEIKVLQAFLDEINSRIASGLPNIIAGVKAIVYAAIQQCPECSSLRDHKLKFDFGLDFDPVDIISKTISDSVTPTYKPFKLVGKTNIVGEFSLSIQPADYFELLSLDQAKVRTEIGEILPWLSWLLTSGDAIIITGFHVKYKNAGRSGGAIMVPKGIFKVDPAFSGTQIDNFITRALIPRGNDILNILEKYI